MNSESHNAREAEFDERLAEVKAERTKYLNSSEGESLSLEDEQDIYIQVKAEFRDKYNFNLNTRNKQGDIADYLESRRPFGATN
mmetsp:Transcript_32902/g.50312  ORF Transcript_32902/g.50312 Transcript_32902/m.50312 type:complete len:84 (+) Transcript_32902:431-682(+)